MRSLTLAMLTIALLIQGFALADGCALTLAMNIEELVDRADTIALGECVEAEERWQPIGGANLPITLYTFAVDDMVCGESTTGQITFRQYGHSSASVADRGDIDNIPRFTPGERYLLLLAEPSPVTGLTAPVGLEQGAFLETEHEGQTVLINGRLNAGLLDGISESAQGTLRGLRMQTQSPAETLLSLVRELVKP